MTDHDQNLQSIRLFFESFTQHLRKIRDATNTANPVQRAHVMLGQLKQFERAFTEQMRARADEAELGLSVADLMQAGDLVSFFSWLTKSQQLVRVTDVFYLNSDNHWERVHGTRELPDLEPFQWVVKSSFAERQTDAALICFLCVFSEIRVVARIESGETTSVEMARDMARFVAKLLPTYVRSRVRAVRSRPHGKIDLIAVDPRFLKLLSMIERAASTNVGILLEGESGTGKEVIANYIHKQSPRRNKTFVAVNCAAIPAGLIESELFGHEKGSFTGAYQRQVGRIEKADGGTLFLDEIGEMELPMQSKLLRFLQLHEFHRVGGKQKLSVDVRIIAATNRNLKQHVQDGQFREDLFYRLSVMPFFVPPLRDRFFDIEPLTRYFFGKYAKSFGFEPPDVDPDVFQLMAAYEYPGNVRELENLVQNVLVLAQGNRIQVHHLPESIRGLEPRGVPLVPPAEVVRRYRQCGKRTGTFKWLRPLRVPSESNSWRKLWKNRVPQTNAELKQAKQAIQDQAAQLTLELEKDFLDVVLERADGSMPKAAEMARINRTLLYKIVERTKSIREN